jgi:hypothetical protein
MHVPGREKIGKIALTPHQSRTYPSGTSVNFRHDNGSTRECSGMGGPHGDRHPGWPPYRNAPGTPPTRRRNRSSADGIGDGPDGSDRWTRTATQRVSGRMNFRTSTVTCRAP